MDLSYTSNLDQEERFEIASLMHAMVIDEIFRQTDWVAGEAVFHGGTSLSLARNSTRFSEDLDFMVAEENAVDIEKTVKKVRDRIALTLSVHYPGCSIELRGPKFGEVSQWLFVWSHPARRGNVQVKTEFLITSKNLLADYASTHVIPNGRNPIIVKSQVPVPVLVSAWADKIKAMATRPAFKWRDAYDLAYIAQCMVREDVSDEDKARALIATAAIYSKTLSDVEVGLNRVLEAGMFDKIEAFEKDMGRWFDQETFQSRKKRDLFQQDLISSRQQVESALNVIKEYTPSTQMKM